MFCFKALKILVESSFAYVLDSSCPSFDPLYISTCYLDPCFTNLIEDSMKPKIKEFLQGALITNNTVGSTKTDHFKDLF